MHDGRAMDTKAKAPEVESPLCRLLTLSLYTRYLISLCSEFSSAESGFVDSFAILTLRVANVNKIYKTPVFM